MRILLMILFFSCTSGVFTQSKANLSCQNIFTESTSRVKTAKFRLDEIEKLQGLVENLYTHPKFEKKLKPLFEYWLYFQKNMDSVNPLQTSIPTRLIQLTLNDFIHSIRNTEAKSNHLMIWKHEREMHLARLESLLQMPDGEIKHKEFIKLSSETLLHLDALEYGESSPTYARTHDLERSIGVISSGIESYAGVHLIIPTTLTLTPRDFNFLSLLPIWPVGVRPGVLPADGYMMGPVREAIHDVNHVFDQAPENSHSNDRSPKDLSFEEVQSRFKLGAGILRRIHNIQDKTQRNILDLLYFYYNHERGGRIVYWHMRNFYHRFINTKYLDRLIYGHWGGGVKALLERMNMEDDLLVAREALGLSSRQLEDRIFSDIKEYHRILDAAWRD